jgi:hypothetical protein
MKAYREEQKKIAPRDIFLEKKAALFFSIIRLFMVRPNNILTRMLFLILFPFSKKGWYIDFDAGGRPIQKKMTSYTA